MKGEHMMDTTTDGDEIVHFALKKKYWDVVQLAVVNAMVSHTQPASVIANATTASGIDWSDAASMLKLRKALDKLPIAFMLMELVAAANEKNSGASVTFEEIYRAAGFADGQRARSSLGAFTKIIKRDFPDYRSNPTWPVVISYNERGEASYTMKREVANAWLNSAP
jgi:hypothetical protein